MSGSCISNTYLYLVCRREYEAAMERLAQKSTLIQQRQPQRLLETGDERMDQAGGRMGSETRPETHGSDRDSDVTTVD